MALSSLAALVASSMLSCGGDAIRLGDGPVILGPASSDAGLPSSLPAPSSGISTPPKASDVDPQPVESGPEVSDTDSSTTDPAVSSSPTEAADASALDTSDPGESISDADTSADSGADLPDAAVCEHAQIPAQQVLWIGDTWVTLPGIQHEGVRDHARNIGAIGQADDYTVLAYAQAGIAEVTQQYTTQQASDVKPKVVIMDGGTWDTLSSMGAQESVDRVVQGFEDLLVQIAADGSVERIVYYLVPELPKIYGVAALRAPLRQLCEASPVPCVFIDLQDIWLDPEAYTFMGYQEGIQASSIGATAIANEIWRVMQRECIAQ